MRADAERTQHISARLVATAAEVAFTAPPVPLRLKLVQGAQDWSLFIQANPPGPARGIVQWLEPYNPLRVEFGARGVIRADFDPLPAAWAQMFGDTQLEMLDLEPNGQAVITITGQRASLAGFVRRLRGTQKADIRSVGKTPVKERLLTAAQTEALQAAVTHGYYLVPRAINLRQLAKLLNTSSASLSERLRRAEGRILTEFVSGGGEAAWDDRALFDTQTARTAGPLWSIGNDIPAEERA